MVMKLMKYGIVIVILAAFGVSYLLKGVQDVKYGVAVAQSNPIDIAVNEQPNSCDRAAAETVIPKSFKKVAENERLELYLEEESVAIAVKDKCNGYGWFSYDVNTDLSEAGYSAEMINYIKSGISIITYDKFTPGRRTVLGDKAQKQYQMKEDGFTVTVDFTKAQVKFDVSVTLKAGDVIVQIPKESVKEDPDLWQPGNDDISLSEVILYPFFGSVTHKDNGYMVIPDGSGAIVKLSETPKYATGYSAPVYGSDPGYESAVSINAKRIAVKPLERVSMPMYGIIHDVDRAGLLVISEDGAGYATYNYVSKGLQSDYYQSYFNYIYRAAYSQFQSRVKEDQHILGFQEKPNQFDLVQRYVFLNGKQANYVGAAKGFRDFLVKKDGLSKKAESGFGKVPMKIDFINNEVTMGTLGAENVPATTYKQAREIVQTLKGKGYDALHVSFRTFSKEDLGYRFKAMNNLGGSGALKETTDYFDANHVKFSYYADYARSYYEKTRYTASKLNRKDMGVANENKSLFNFLNNPKYFKVMAEQDLNAYKKFNIRSLALDGFGASLFTHYDHGTIGYSNEGMAYIENTLQQLKEQGIETNLYTPDAYLYKYINDYYDAPIASSELIFIDETIPLVSLVLSGYADLYSPYMNFSSNDTDSMLRLIEFGIYPAFVLTGDSTYDIKYTASNDVYTSEYKYLKDRMDFYYSSISQALTEVLGSEMVDHRMIEPGVVRVEYSNGKKILINYNSTDMTYEDVKIKSKGFVIL
ncbi:DUF5696 domain-containing protein [Paenibacillus thermotolerans]|uniref:DUF5696 domain-containing protein n=1 Tax=Paenibacillus thermotolerans TaxID=3027807 RepID=UPI002367B477|nr:MULTISPECIES: DUF5696 domain-containing protein [unclassified Paenibacillus]